MSLIRWHPWRDIERWESLPSIDSLQQEMNRLFDRLLPSDAGGNGITFMPAAEMDETPEAVEIKLEIPGLEAKDLNVEVTDDAVKIGGERKSETKTEEKGMVRSEFRYGKFERVIPLPVRVKTDGVAAEYKNGILKVTLPKTEEQQRKAIEIKVA
ncbi:MAG: Hsp20/alpha crystallin family protein [Cyanosarcina radialis HA8281-LM2]|jgi:HSP20 family protein|nr:Hsp20/alpha crystallin family protein [Cyanosarcina radialis HA8281-LM2]